MISHRIGLALGMALLIPAHTVVGADADVERLQIEADAGNASSQCLLGSAYLYGKGTPQNFQKAVFWLRKSAAATNQYAQVLLYQCFVSGAGVPESEAHQIGILRKLSNEGDHASQRLLGLMLGNKAFSSTNSAALNVEAYKWLSLASAKIPSAAKDRENVRLEMSAASTTAAQRQAELFRPSPPTALVFTDDWRIISQKQQKP